MLVYAAILPHTPLLLPPLYKKTKGFEKTRKAVETASMHLAETRPDTLVMASPHSENLPGKFSIQVCDSYHADFKKFGDLSTSISLKPNYPLIDQVQRELRRQNEAVSLLTCSPLDYGLSIPLLFISEKTGPLLVPLNQSDLSFKKHFEFGKKIGDIIEQSGDRIAVAASAHLSHRLSEAAPRGFAKEGPKYDSLIQEALASQNYSRILNIPKALPEAAEQCGLRSICILLGIFSHIKHSSRILDYNPYLGVGYITAEFII